MWQKIKSNTHIAINWTKTHRKAATWIVISILGLFILVSIKSCSATATSATPAPGSGWLFMKLAFAGLIWVTYATREKPYLAWTFAGLATLTFLVLLGKLDNIVAWGVLGLPILAGIGILGYTKIDGRMKSFLGFTSGILILFWMLLLLQGYTVNIGFLGIMFPDDMAKIIFTVFFVTFIFAIWKRSKFFYAVAIVAFLSFLGNGVIDEMTSRFPDKLVPKTGGEISQGVGNLRNSVGKAMTRLSKEWDNPTPKTVAPPSPTPTTSAPAPVVPKPQPDKPVKKPTVKTTVAQSPAPVTPPVEKPVVEIWNISFFDDGQLQKQNVELTRTGDNMTLLAADGTEIVVSPTKSKGSYVGTITLHGKNPGKCVINLSGLVGSGWWEDTPADIHFTLKRLS